jgi:hypothetical protein
MKKERSTLLIGPKRKHLELLRNIRDSILNRIEIVSGRIHNWAWNQRWKERDPEEWVRGYREWKKTRCPHN